MYDIPVLFKQFKLQFIKSTTEFAEPETTRKKSEFVISCMLDIVTTPAAVIVSFPVILTLGVPIPAPE